MKFDLTAEEVHVLIAWHDEEAGWDKEYTWDPDLARSYEDHRARADQLFFMLTGAKRKHSKSTSEPK